MEIKQSVKLTPDKIQNIKYFLSSVKAGRFIESVIK